MECHKYIFYLWIFWSSFNWFFFGNFIKELLAVNKYLNIFMDLSHYSCVETSIIYFYLKTIDGLI